MLIFFELPEAPAFCLYLVQRPLAAESDSSRLHSSLTSATQSDAKFEGNVGSDEDST
jgi:hypothetical protein